MSLRTRLLLAVGLVLLLALAAADLAVRAELRASLYDSVDASLATSEHAIAGMLEPQGPGRPAAGGSSSGEPDQDDAGAGGRATWGAPGGGASFCNDVELNLAPGTFVELRRTDGRARSGYTCPAREAGHAYSPKLPAKIPGLAGGGRPGQPPARFTAASAAPNGPAFEVVASPLGGGPGAAALVLATPLTSTDHTLAQLLSIELAVSGAALVVGSLLGWLLVHLELRPLRDIERTAGSIAEGRLTSRVPGANGRTEVGHLASALNVMLSRIEQAFGARDATESELRASEARMRRFVGDASHELRTPLAAVSAYAELFEQGAASRPGDLRRAMSGIRTETARMSHLVEDLLLLARLDEGRPLDMQPLELVGIAAEAIETARAVGGEWRVRLEASEPVELRGDRLRLRQVVDNLLANVRAHTPAGTAATVAVRPEGEAALLEVRDEGPGIAPEHAGQVFNRFYRADASRARSRGGAGLGLSIVASIVAAHGGSVEVDSTPAVGTVFRLRLPRRLPPAGGAGQEAPPAAGLDLAGAWATAGEEGAGEEGAEEDRAEAAAAARAVGAPAEDQK